MMKKYKITIEGTVSSKVNTSFYFLASSETEALEMLNSEVSHFIIKDSLLDQVDFMPRKNFELKIDPHRIITEIKE